MDLFINAESPGGIGCCFFVFCERKKQKKPFAGKKTNLEIMK